MKLVLCSVGKESNPYISTGLRDFTERIGRYFLIEWRVISSLKNTANLSEKTLKSKEAALILKSLKKDDYVIALDERGKMLTSTGLASMIHTKANESTRQLVFLIGGAYGLGEEVIKRANFVWSLSSLTFPHQLVRLILAEQVYRACTIIKNEKYHHA